MDVVVRLRSAVCLLDRFPALTGVDLDIGAGEVVLVEGPNGAGKTTLLRMLAGLERVADGEAHVLGIDLRRDRRAVRRQLRRQVGLVGHDTFLYDDLTVTDNVRFWARAAGGDPADADAALDRLDVPARLRDLPVAQLSTGQRRRTSIAAMITRRPRLWLMDEPHAGLDQGARDLVDRLVAEAAARGATVVLSSHEIERAGALASRRVHLVGGRIRAAGPPAVAAAQSTAPEVAGAP